MLFSMGIILLAILFAVVELPPLIKEKRMYPSILYISLMGIGSIVSVLYGLDLPLPNPLDTVIFLFEPLSTWLFNLLK